MDSPRSGFRRAAAASWALTGLGLVGVAGASALAYAETVKPPAAEAPVVAVEPAPPELGPTPILDLPPVPDVPVTTVDPPPITSETTVAKAPVPAYTRVPEYTPVPTVERAPPAVTQQAPKPSATTPPTTKRRLAPTTVVAPNYSPHITVSRGS